MCPMCDGMMGPWGWVMMLLAALFWIAVIGGLAWFLYTLARRRGWMGGDAAPRDPEEVLRDRYARGDIDRATYERMREDLHRDRPA